jgi:hypothetical protein
VAEDEKVVDLLKSIDRRLALLTAPQERAMRQALERDLLRSEGRIKTFNAIDGIRTSPEIAKVAGVGDRAVQLFVKELLDAGLLRDTGSSSGRAIVVEHNQDAIVQLFAASIAES